MLELRLYSISQASKELGISRATLHSLINEGRIGVIKISKRTRISHTELQRFLSENTILKENFKQVDDLEEFMSARSGRGDKREIINKELFTQILNEVTNG